MPAQMPEDLSLANDWMPSDHASAMQQPYKHATTTHVIFCTNEKALSAAGGRTDGLPEEQLSTHHANIFPRHTYLRSSGLPR